MPFKKGEINNPRGRPKGSRHKLQEDFLKDLIEVWEKKGKKALEVACVTSPMKFVEMVASLQPSETKVDVTNTINIESESVRALTGWIEGTARDITPSKNENSLPS